MDAVGTTMDRLGRRRFLGLGASLIAAGTWCRGRSREAPEQRGGGPRVMQGKICLITGATSGIGAVAALELARLGATVLVAGRDAAKCKAHADAIRRETGARAEEVVADLASLDQVRRMASEVSSRYARLDVLVNNAGTYLFERTLTRDGLERTFAVNYLSHFLLTNLLLHRLAATPGSRVVCVSSSAHLDGRIDFDNLQGERRYERLDAYARSKLALLMFTYELARRRKGASPTANALHPGVVATDLGAENGLVRGWLRNKVRNVVNRSMITPEEGARPIVQVASSPELEGITGRYFDRGQEARSSPASHDETVARRLWEVSEELTRPRT
jgi:NAD(P)-dependent dehydrogenase (short-subunit alcohol dehydrogenase family)